MIDATDLDRRRILTVMTGATAAVGAVSACLPLVGYLGRVTCSSPTTASSVTT